MLDVKTQSPSLESFLQFPNFHGSFYLDPWTWPSSAMGTFSSLRSLASAAALPCL